MPIPGPRPPDKFRKRFPKKESGPVRDTAPAAGAVVVSPRGVERLKAGHVWVYRSDVVSAKDVAAGTIVPVHDHRGKFLGTALYSSNSQIAVRLISQDVVADVSALIQSRIRDAVVYRGQVVSNTDAYRVVFSEADFLPGLIVDRYHDVLSLQILTQAMDAEPVRAAILEQLQESLHPAGIVERVDARVRELEQLPARASGLVAGERGNTVFTMNGVRFHFDALEGQKTGAFLDQRENYAAAVEYARGEMLDVFCYQGGFALHLAKKANKVTAVDSSRPALEVADKNAFLNQSDIEWIEANAFDLLKDYSQAGRQYDTIVLDPPAFAKTRKNLETAVRGYKELNLRALKMLRPGGSLITCSCSYHLSEAEFLDVVADAARDSRRTLRLLEKRGASKDHPVVLGVPETSYLKCLILQVSH
jgi:23S rRNA (cytosine1962-C5)-methyltransferase